MTEKQRVFYRSQVTRAIFITTGLYVSFAFSPLGPDAWRRTPSLRLISASGIPWWAVAALFGVYSFLFLLGLPAASEWASWLGLGLYAVAAVSVAITIRFDRPTNPMAVAALLGMCVLHYQSGRLAQIQQRLG